MSEEKGKYDLDKVKRENAVLRKYAAMQNAAEEKIGCQKIYIDIAGSIEAAFVLDELIYFTLPRPETGRSGLRVWKDGVLWMAVSRTEWWERKRLTPKQADGAIEKLVGGELVFKDLFLFNKQSTTHLRLNVSQFFKRYAEELEKRNQPEDESDTMQKDISDLYEMLGIPKGDTPQEGYPEMGGGIPKGDTVSPNGDSINSPNTSLTQPLNTGAEAPKLELSIENQIYAGSKNITIPDEFQAKIKDAANLIAMGMGGLYAPAYELAYSFMKSRNILIPHGKVKGNRKAAREMLEMGVRPEHVTQAVEKLSAQGMTFTDLFGVSKTAIDLANPPRQSEAPRLPHVSELNLDVPNAVPNPGRKPNILKRNL